MDFIGITLQYEMCYTNILQILDLGQIPLLSKDRSETDPLIIGGGPVLITQSHWQIFLICFILEKGRRCVYFDLLDAFKENQACGEAERNFLERAAEIPGIYVPAFYDVSYKEDGTLASFTPNNPHAKEKIRKEVEMDLSHTYYPKASSSTIYKKRHRIVLFWKFRGMYSRMPVLSGRSCVSASAGEKSCILKRGCL